MSPDHLDQYNYNYRKEYALQNLELPKIKKMTIISSTIKTMKWSKLPSKLDLVKQIPFSMKEKLEEGGYTEEEKNCVVKLHDEFSMKIEDLSLMGTHNVLIVCRINSW